MAFQCTDCKIHIIGKPHFTHQFDDGIVQACEACYQEYYQTNFECTCSDPTDDPSDFCLENPEQCDHPLK